MLLRERPDFSGRDARGGPAPRGTGPEPSRAGSPRHGWAALAAGPAEALAGGGHAFQQLSENRPAAHEEMRPGGGRRGGAASRSGTPLGRAPRSCPAPRLRALRGLKRLGVEPGRPSGPRDKAKPLWRRRRSVPRQLHLGLGHPPRASVSPSAQLGSACLPGWAAPTRGPSAGPTLGSPAQKRKKETRPQPRFPSPPPRDPGL